eukprot:c575_g1_i1.p1 GENE.c575_g1_i1~~c575_g1_i1.p1  ORF type:complete len:135 (+),score=40.42 c575_g1_i1:52-405(+)
MSAYLGMACIADELDKKILVVLRDGRNLVGTLRSFDQFANMMLDNTFERIVAGGKFCDIPLGVFLIRGENVILMGEMDAHKDLNQKVLTRVGPEEIFELQRTSPHTPNCGLPFDDLA